MLEKQYSGITPSDSASSWGALGELNFSATRKFCIVLCSPPYFALRLVSVRGPKSVL